MYVCYIYVCLQSAAAWLFDGLALTCAEHTPYHSADLRGREVGQGHRPDVETGGVWHHRWQRHCSNTLP